MAEVKAFQGVYYNKEKIEDLKDVVSPPYDIISDEQQTALLNLSPYNFTHIDFNKDKIGDDKDQNKYTRAAVTFESWLRKGIMVQDETPCLYFYKQEYTIMGQKYNRLGIIALLELERHEGSKVHPHENTHARAVEDRLRLTKALSANLSCIFVCYSDRQKKVEKIFNKYVVHEKPLVDVIGPDKVRHKLWKLDEEELIREITSSVSGQNLFIADGHHRFKVAQEYQEYRLSKKTGSTGEEPFNYVMTYFTNMDSKDLQILPMHRIVKRMPKGTEFLEEFFRIDKVKRKEDLIVLLAKAGKNEHAFGLYMRDGILLLRLKNKSLISELIHEGSKEYKNLDATILKYFVFDKLGILSEDILYTSSFQDVMEKVDSSQAEAGFVLNPVKIQELKAIALNGDRMPPKTTYFFPKVLSGLTVYKMD